MPILNFKEITEAHKGTGLQDTFELFARDFLELLGYTIISEPARGADGGADLIIEEERKGIGGVSKVSWLVSCKHNAHSGKSVSPTDESNIRDRVETNNCSGFMGFYSTLPSSGLSNTLKSFENKMEIQVFDKERIEGQLLNSPQSLDLAKRFFPQSVEFWLKENPTPAKIFNIKPSTSMLK